MGTPVNYSSGDYGSGDYARFIGYGAASFGKAAYGVWTERTDVEVDIVVTSSSTVIVEGAERVIEAEFGTVYGSGAYGQDGYGKAILSTSSATCSALIVKDGQAATTSQSATTASAEQVYQGSAISAASATTSADIQDVHQSGATSTATALGTASGVYSIVVAINIGAGNSVTASNYVRIRSTDNAIVSTTSVTTALGREKWELLDIDAQDWDTIDLTSTSWTEIVNDSNTWTNAA